MPYIFRNPKGRAVVTHTESAMQCLQPPRFNERAALCAEQLMEVYAIRYESRKLYRLYTRLDYARDGVSGDKMICDWVSARSVYHFLRGLAAGLECE